MHSPVQLSTVYLHVQICTCTNMYVYMYLSANEFALVGLSVRKYSVCCICMYVPEALFSAQTRTVTRNGTAHASRYAQESLSAKHLCAVRKSLHHHSWRQSQSVSCFT